MRESSPVPECSSAGLRCWVPEYRCRRHWTRGRCPAMLSWPPPPRKTLCTICVLLCDMYPLDGAHLIFNFLGPLSLYSSSYHRVHILVEMKQGQCICPLSWSVHCNLTGEGKCNKRGWACTPLHPHQPGLILPLSLNVRQKAGVATLCTLWFIISLVNKRMTVNMQ
jgi:hypothetical protein